MLTIVFVAVGLVSAFAAPADLNTPEQQFQSDVQNAFQPVEADIRSMISNARSTQEDLTQQLSESGKNIIAAGKNLLVPYDKEDRANIAGAVTNRGRAFTDEVQKNLRSIMDKASVDVKSLVNNQRSAMVGSRSAVQSLENKYLTKDGQDLVKTMLTMAISK